MASRVPLLLKNKGRKPTRLPIAPRVKPSNADRSKRLSTGEPSSASDVPADVDSSTSALEPPEHEDDASASIATAQALDPPLDVTVMPPTSATPPAQASVPVQQQPQPVRSASIAPGGSLASCPASAASRPRTPPSTTVRSPILPVQRASEQRTHQVERLAKISSAGPVYRPSSAGANGGGHHVSPVLGPRATVLHPPAINTQEHPVTKRMVRKLDIKPHQSPRRAAQASALLHAIPPLSSAGLLPAARVASPAAASTSSRSPVASATGSEASSTSQPPASQKQTASPTPKRVRAKDAAASARKVPKRRSADTPSAQSPAPANGARRSLRRSAKKASSYRDASDSRNDDDEDPATTHDQGDDDDGDDEDADPSELDAADADESSSVQVYVPARERATLWAKSVLKQQQDSDNAESNDTDADPSARRTVSTLAKSTRASPAARRKRSPSSSSLSSTKAARAKVEELLKKEPSQMTMGELALTVPKGKRVNRHEHEVAASEALATTAAAASGGAGSSLLNPHALNRVRSFSVSSESAALGGSIVTPQVEIIDGKMVILEATVKISDVAHRRPDDDSGEHDDALPRRSGARYYAQPTTPGKRWAKDETKQFYYCLSQVGPNFSMMATLFPNRKRKELKCKFKYEEKHHPALIEIALKASAAPLDSEMVSVIAQMVDKDAKTTKAKLLAKAATTTGKDVASVESPASAALGATPPPPHADFLDDFDEFYQRERSHSFDFAG